MNPDGGDDAAHHPDHDAAATTPDTTSLPFADVEARRQRLLELLESDESDPSTPQSERGDGALGGGVVAAVDPAVSRPGPWGLPSRLARVCALSMSIAGVDGAGVTVMGSLQGAMNGARDQLAATGALTRRLEELQLTTGEGPCVDAYRTGVPVLVNDLAAHPRRWLGFGPEAISAGAAALFSLPLQVGVVRLGTLDLHRATPGPLRREQLADALALASLTTEILLELAETPDTDTVPADVATVPTSGWLPNVHADVHVAAGMLSVQWGTNVGAALLRIRAYAFAQNQPLHNVARRIIDRTLDAHSDIPEPEPRADDDLPPRPPAPDPENDDP